MGNLNSGKKGGFDPDAAWRQQNKESQENPMYRFADLGGGGCLKDALQSEGEEAVRKIAREELHYFLYNGGHGQTVKRVDYAKWKHRCEAKISGTSLVDIRTDEEILAEFEEDDVNKFTEHDACWDLSTRGGVGETALHLLFLSDTPVHIEVVRILLSMYPQLAQDYYEGDEYYGEGSLHLAVIHKDMRSVKLLIECGANVNLRCSGRFFLPEDQKKKRTNNTNYEGYAYYGEYSLAFAACMGFKNIYDYLITQGADPNLQDTFGNSVLHMIVIANRTDMFTYAVKHHHKKANIFLKNKQGLTPLTLAAKLGRSKLFRVVMELGSIDNWCYSNIKCSVYPLGALDTVDSNGETNWKSALMFIIDGESDEHLEMLEGGVVTQLLDDKWKTFAKRRFFERLILAVLHLIIISIAVYTRPSAGDLIGPTDFKSIVRYISEIIVCLNCLVFLVFELLEIRSQGVIGLLKNLRNAPAQAVFTISCILILFAIPFRFANLVVVEETVIIIALPGSWSFLLFFARLHMLLGPNVIMMYRMIRYDVIRFIVIYGIILLGFTQAFYFLFKDIKNSNIKTFKTVYGSVMTLIKMTFGEFEYDDFDHIHYPYLAKIAFFVFMIIVPILLLNMLIAMMGNTYHQVISKSEKEWRRQWAKVVIVLERTFNKKAILGFQDRYSVPLDGPPDGYVSDESGIHRALMVIKSTAKTRARQRKGAISNWMKLCSGVRDALRRHKSAGNTGPLFFDTDSEDDDDDGPPDTHLVVNPNRPLSAKSQNDISAALKQLAWEKDIDLTKGKAFSQPLVDDDTETQSSNQSLRDITPLIKKSKSDLSFDNPALTTLLPNGREVNGKNDSLSHKGHKTHVKASRDMILVSRGSSGSIAAWGDNK